MKKINRFSDFSKKEKMVLELLLGNASKEILVRHEVDIMVLKRRPI